ncbi:MAG: FlgD immunoglobulin-like domain containing protein [Candidatus Limnocylindrales bacterium]
MRRIAIATLLAVGLSPVPLAQAADQAGQSPRSASPAQASVHYDDAMRHATERIRFKPGGRVTVPYKPRAGDDWTVDGHAPKALPAGALSGAQIAASGADPEAPSETDDASPTHAIPDGPAFEAASSSTVVPVPTSASQPRLGGPEAWMSDRILAAPVSSGGLRREVFGFLPYWELTDASTRLDYSVLSTIAYFGVGADKDGHLIRKHANGTRDVGWAGWTSSALTAVINEAHAKRTRVVLTVQRFAWTTNQVAATKALLASPDARRTLAGEIAKAVADRGADGVNLDFEPIPSGYGDEYVAFVRSVRKALDARAAGYQLTFDTTGSIGTYDLAALTARGAADAVFIMGYDYRTSGSSTAGSISPLAGPRYDLTDTVDAYLARIGPGKIILGVPYYGRAWSTTSDALNAPTRKGSAMFGYSTSVLYATAAATAAKHDRRWDPIEATPWTAYRWKACPDCPSTWRQLYFDDSRSLGMKYDLINARGLRGAGIWALGYDDARPELYALLKAKFREDSTPPTAGILLLPSSTRDATVRVRWTGRDDTAVERYDVQVSVDGGSWSTWLDDTTRTSGTYTGGDGHGYAFRVRARDKKGHWSDWNVGDTWRPRVGSLRSGSFVRVTAASLTMRAAPNTSARKVGKAAEGARLRIVGGPRSKDGYTWHKVVGPLKEWGPVATSTRSGAWVATRSGSGAQVKVVPAPNTTTLDVLVDDLGIGAVDTIRATKATSAGRPSTLPAAFSPSGDKARDGLRIAYRLDASLDALTLRILRQADGAPVGSRALPGRARGRHVFDWDGTLHGKRLPDGAYLVQLVGKRGSTSASAPAASMTDPTFDAGAWTTIVDTSAPTVSGPDAAPPAFSPDGDGRQDGTTIKAAAGPGATAWSVRILAVDGDPVRTFEGRGREIKATWNGRTAGGARVPNGRYRVEVRVDDALGNTATVSGSIVVDTTDPTGAVVPAVPGLVAGATSRAFSPDGDRWQDTVALRVAADEPVKATISVRNSAGKVVWSGSTPMGEAPSVVWRGRHRSGGTLKDGTYRVLARVTDAAGNRARLTGTVRIDRTAGFLRSSPGTFFPQDGDALARTARVTFKLRGKATTTLRVLDNSGAVVRTAWKSRSRSAGSTAWTWDGRGSDGAMLPRGSYQLELIATAGGVTQVVRRGVTMDAFAITPSSATPAAGSRLTLVIRSTEPLGSAPVVTLSQAGTAARTVTAKRRGDGRYRATFTLTAGVTGTATVSVKATDARRGTNTATIKLTIR